MKVRLGLWRQSIKRHFLVILLVSLSAILVVLVILGGYKFNWEWTGFNGSNKSGKTLWDWMQLLFIPVVLAVAGFWFNHRERKAAELRAEADREISFDNQRDATLKEYIDKISELLLKEHLGELTSEGKLKPEYDQVRTIARARTLTVLPQLDAKRKGSILHFLSESKLINIIDLSEADLSGAKLNGLKLSNAKLRQAKLSEADLTGADLSEADLLRANLSKACLVVAILGKAILFEANLQEANLFHADLYDALLCDASLIKANLSESRLCEANLSGARLIGADMRKSDLSKADLNGANLNDSILDDATLIGAAYTAEQLNKAKSLKGTVMFDETVHP